VDQIEDDPKVGKHFVCGFEGGWPFYTFSDAAVTTAERIVETIYMALLASAVGTLLAVPVSFLAARNLMENITWPLASVSAALVGVIIGGATGWLISSKLVGLTDFVAQQPWLGLLALVVSVAVLWMVTRLGPPLLTEEERSTGMKLLTAVRIVLALLILIVGLAQSLCSRSRHQLGRVTGQDPHGSVDFVRYGCIGCRYSRILCLAL
jgi:hypothetical protein